MTDISIGKSFSVGNDGRPNAPKSEYEKIRKEYSDFRRQIAKSDLSNSPVALKQEIVILTRLLAAAKNEGLTDIQQKIETKIQEIQGCLQRSQTGNDNAYYRPVMHRTSLGKRGDYKELIEECKNSKGEMDIASAKIVETFGDEYLSHMPSLLRRCRNGQEEISQNMLDTVLKLAKEGHHPNIIISLLDSFVQRSDGFDGDIILPDKVVEQFEGLTSSGLKPYDAIKMMKFLNEGFENVDSIQPSAVNMYKMGMDTEKIKDVIDVLGVLNPETGKAVVSKDSLNTIVSVKRVLNTTRTNDRKETSSPIAKLGVKIIDYGSFTCIIKDGKMNYIYHNEGETIQDLEENYINMLKEQEDDICVNFAKKYRDKNGEININYGRVLSNLRRNGVANESLLKLTDYCTDKGIIKKDNLVAIASLKSAGALSEDLIPILESIPKDDGGKLDAESLQDACELTNAVIGGKDVIKLLPEVKNNSNVKDLVVYLSQFFEDKDYLHSVVSLLKTADDKFDQNAIDTMYDLAMNFFISEDGPMAPEEFINNSEEILISSINPKTKIIDDEAAGICAIMCQNHETPQNILDGLNICKNNEGVIDSDLAEVLWDLSLDKTSFEDIKKVISSCKTITGEINSSFAKAIIAFYDSGHKSKEVISMVKKLHQAE